MCLLLTVFGIRPAQCAPKGRPAPRKRDGTAVRRLALRPEEVLARGEALNRFTNWMETAAPRHSLDEIARYDAPV